MVRIWPWIWEKSTARGYHIRVEAFPVSSSPTENLTPPPTKISRKANFNRWMCRTSSCGRKHAWHRWRCACGENHERYPCLRYDGGVCIIGEAERRLEFNSSSAKFRPRFQSFNFGPSNVSGCIDKKRRSLFERKEFMIAFGSSDVESCACRREAIQKRIFQCCKLMTVPEIDMCREKPPPPNVRPGRNGRKIGNEGLRRRPA